MKTPYGITQLMLVAQVTNDNPSYYWSKLILTTQITGYSAYYIDNIFVVDWS